MFFAKLGQILKFVTLLHAEMKRKLCLAILLAFLCLALPARRKAPLVGVSAGISRGGSHIVPNTYVDAVRKAGGEPVILPVLTDSAAVEALVARLDGLLFTGGEDVDPARYGEAVLPDAGVSVNARRDTSDLLYARIALRRRKAVLGICRGAQLLNVAAGGSLYQDLPLQHPGPVAHRQDAPDGEPSHPVLCDRDAFLYQIYGLDTLAVNSFHHQAVKVLAPSFTVAAVAPDGIVEAYWNRRVLAVQFHPEKMLSAGDEGWLPLFRAFIARCRRRR